MNEDDRWTDRQRDRWQRREEKNRSRLKVDNLRNSKEPNGTLGPENSLEKPGSKAVGRQRKQQPARTKVPNDY